MEICTLLICRIREIIYVLIYLYLCRVCFMFGATHTERQTEREREIIQWKRKKGTERQKERATQGGIERGSF